MKKAALFALAVMVGLMTVTPAGASVSQKKCTKKSSSSCKTAREKVIGEWTDSAGWKYQMTVMSASTTVTGSPAQHCITVPPPSQTNIKFTIKIENLIADRPAPIPSITTGLNLVADGSAVDP